MFTSGYLVWRSLKQDDERDTVEPHEVTLTSTYTSSLSMLIVMRPADANIARLPVVIDRCKNKGEHLTITVITVP